MLSKFGGAEKLREFLKTQADPTLQENYFNTWGKVRNYASKGRGLLQRLI